MMYGYSVQLVQKNYTRHNLFLPERKKQLSLSPWQTTSGSEEAMPNFDDSKWKKSKDPLQMGADGDLNSDAWYRTTVNIDSTGIYSLQVDGGDRATGFIDGKIASSGNIKDGELTFNIQKGKHTLAIFTAHDGRDKLAGYMGAIDSSGCKRHFWKSFFFSKYGRQSYSNFKRLEIFACRICK